MQRDSVLGTLTVAAVLCIVCSVIVSSASVGLRPIQDANKRLFQRKNILVAAGLIEDVNQVDAETVDELFSSIEVLLIDLETGAPVSEGIVDPSTYDEKLAAKDPALSVAIEPDNDLAGIKRREKYSRVYLIKNEDGKIEQVVLPVYGKGLWSTLYGFLAIRSDLNTISGLTFYSHKETPGLGGEVDNPSWKSLWKGKLLKDENGNIQIEVVKGEVVPGSDKAKHQVDGLSGATITSRGVSNLIRYWISDDAFGPFLDQLET